MNEQLLHKFTILLQQESSQASMGVILNLPTTESYIMIVQDCVVPTISAGGTVDTSPPTPTDGQILSSKKMKNTKAFDFIIQYGGPSGHKRDDNDNNDDRKNRKPSPFIWLHDNDILKQKEIGICILGHTNTEEQGFG